MKATVKENPNKPIQQIYQEEQSKMINTFGDMQVAAALPQFRNVQSGLYKQRADLVPPNTKKDRRYKMSGVNVKTGKGDFCYTMIKT